MPSPTNGNYSPRWRTRPLSQMTRQSTERRQTLVQRTNLDSLVARSARPLCPGVASARARQPDGSRSTTPTESACAAALKRPRERAPRHERSRRQAAAAQSRARAWRRATRPASALGRASRRQRGESYNARIGGSARSATVAERAYPWTGSLACLPALHAAIANA